MAPFRTSKAAATRNSIKTNGKRVKGIAASKASRNIKPQKTLEAPLAVEQANPKEIANQISKTSKKGSRSSCKQLTISVDNARFEGALKSAEYNKDENPFGHESWPPPSPKFDIYRSVFNSDLMTNRDDCVQLNVKHRASNTWKRFDSALNEVGVAALKNKNFGYPNGFGKDNLPMDNGFRIIPVLRDNGLTVRVQKRGLNLFKVVHIEDLQEQQRQNFFFLEDFKLGPIKDESSTAASHSTSKEIEPGFLVGGSYVPSPWMLKKETSAKVDAKAKKTPGVKKANTMNEHSPIKKTVSKTSTPPTKLANTKQPTAKKQVPKKAAAKQRKGS